MGQTLKGGHPSHFAFELKELRRTLSPPKHAPDGEDSQG